MPLEDMPTVINPDGWAFDLPGLGVQWSETYPNNAEATRIRPMTNGDYGLIVQGRQALRRGNPNRVPKGWRLVPIDPTDAMLNAAQERLCQIQNPTYFDDDIETEKFVAMVNAAPPAPGAQ